MAVALRKNQFKELSERKQLIQRVKAVCEICNITDAQIETVDHGAGRYVIFNFPDKLNFKEMVKFNDLAIDKEKFFNILEKLDPTLFMTVQKIVFINSEADYDKLVEDYQYNFLNDLEKDIGKFLFFESVVVVNMIAIRKVVEELAEEMSGIVWFNEREEINTGLWMTLVHELRHGQQMNPIYGHLMTVDGMEADAESFCTEVFEEVICKQDFYIL